MRPVPACNARPDTRRFAKARAPFLIAAALAGLVAPAHATDIRPGLWEFRSTRLNVAGLPDLSSQLPQLQQYIRGLPPDMRRSVEQQMAARGVSLNGNGTVRSCITPEQAKQSNLYSGKREGNCTLLDIQKTGATVRGRLTCTDPVAQGEFEAQIHAPEHFTTHVNMRSERGDMQVDSDARWIGADCGARRKG